MFLKNTKKKLKSVVNIMIEKLADIDDDIMDKYLEGEEISIPEIKAAIRKGNFGIGIIPSSCWFCLQE
jgi:elongation factor G